VTEPRRTIFTSDDPAVLRVQIEALERAARERLNYYVKVEQQMRDLVAENTKLRAEFHFPQDKGRRMSKPGYIEFPSLSLVVVGMVILSVALVAATRWACLIQF
jgi:hypothetical protein